MSQQSNRFYEFGPFRMDARERRLLREGKEIKLYPKDFDTLLVLVENSGHALEKDELLEKIWPDAIVEEGSLAQNVSRLRKILGEGSKDAQYIETLPRRGYRFRAEVHEIQGEGLDLIVRRRRRARIITHEDEGDALEDAESVRALPKISHAVKSLAVLPFITLGLEGSEGYLGLGLADALITQLGGTEQMVVRPTSAIRQYTDAQRDSIAIGRYLRVNAVLEGSVQSSGERLRLTVQLVGVREEATLWAGTFDEKLTDIFALQDSISEKVTSALQIRLGGREKKRSTENIEAYQHYMKGRFHIARLTPTEMQTGISYLRQAIEIDSSYALAYVGLADAYLRLSIAAELPSTEFFPKSKVAANKAIEIDDTLAEAYTVLGWTTFWYDWSWNKAENQCRRALKLDPNSVDALEAYAHLLSNTGRHTEGLFEIKRARELNPTSAFVNALEGQFLLHAGNVDEALDRLSITFELEPNFWLAHLFAASAYIEKEMLAEAVVEADKARQFSGGSSHAAAFGAYALAKFGKQTEARAALEELLKLSATRYVPPYHIALVYNGLDEREETLAWLERGYKERDPKMVFLKVEPKWNNLRSEPRFIDLMKRIRLQ